MILIVIIILLTMTFISNRYEKQTMSIEGGSASSSPQRYTKIKDVNSLTIYENIDENNGNVKSLYLFTNQEDSDSNNNGDADMDMDTIVKNNLNKADTSFITNQTTNIQAEKGRVVIRNEEKVFSDKSPMFRRLLKNLSPQQREVIKEFNNNDIDNNVIDIMTIINGNYGKYIIYKNKESIQKMKDILKDMGYESKEYKDGEIPTDKL